MDIVIDRTTLGFAWLVVAIFCAIASAQAAQSKRMSTLGGLLVGGVFGPLGLLAIAAMAPSGTPCRSCCEPIHPRASRCPHCQAADPHGPA